MDATGQLIPPLISLGIVILSIGVLEIWRRRQKARLGKDPVNEKLLRSPGHSIQQKLEKFAETLLFTLLIFWGSCMELGICIPWAWKLFLGPKRISPNLFFDSRFWKLPASIYLAGDLFLFAISILSLALSSAVLIRLLKKCWNYNLGLSGERAVGEELNKLMKEGCDVFHDFPGGPDWNIDHIIIAPSGVFSVETKARRKRNSIKSDNYKVHFDGQQLIFPHGTEKRSLEQAKRNAASLSQFLEKSTGRPVPVSPILVFPGWFVTSSNNTAAIQVTNPKNVRYLVMKNRTRLSNDHLVQIAYQIEQKCRDVEF